MFDAGKTIVGLVVFLVLVTSPLWYNALSAAPSDLPELEGPPDAALDHDGDGTVTAKERSCVTGKQYMRAFHMDLLDDWRDRVVRDGERDYVSDVTGRVFDMSLSRTCMRCHVNKAAFCDRCHDYMSVRPYCWDCHVEPKEVQ